MALSDGIRISSWTLAHKIPHLYLVSCSQTASALLRKGEEAVSHFC